MFAIRQIIEDSQDSIPVPPELRHRRIEVILIDIELEEKRLSSTASKPALASLAGCWEGEGLDREMQGDYGVRKEFE